MVRVVFLEVIDFIRLLQIHDSERIQHYGKCWDEEAGKALSEQEALDMIAPLLKTVSKEYQEAEKWLKNWYLKKSIDLDKME